MQVPGIKVWTSINYLWFVHTFQMPSEVFRSSFPLICHFTPEGLDFFVGIFFQFLQISSLPSPLTVRESPDRRGRWC